MCHSFSSSFLSNLNYLPLTPHFELLFLKNAKMDGWMKDDHHSDLLLDVTFAG